MSLTDLHNMLREVFRWEPDRIAAFVIGIIFCIALGATLYWVYRSWFRFPKGQSANELLELLRKERETTQGVCQRLQTENGQLHQEKSQLTADLRARETEIGGLRQVIDALTQQCEELKDACREVEDAKHTLE